MPAGTPKGFAKGKLKTKAARGGIATIASEVLRGAGRVASTVVLARLLTPDDFGVVAVVAGYLAVLEGLSEGGLSSVALRERTLSAQQSSNLFWCNVILSFTMAGVAIAGAPLLAAFVGEPDVVRYIPVASVALVLRGLGAQQRVILQRELQFGSLARAEAVGIGVNAAVSIGLAVAGFGVWSIFVANVTTSGTMTALRWSISGWRPGRFARGHGTRRLLRRGSGLLVASTISSVRTSADGVILARFTSAADVGLYSKAYGLLMLPMTRLLRPMNRLALPILVQLWDDPDRFRKAYSRLVSFLELVTTPVTAFLFMGAEEIVLIMLGEQFAPSAPIFRVLALASLGMATASSANWVQQASGRIRRQIGLTAWTSVVVISANVLGAWMGGAMGMAIGWVVALQVSRLPTSYFALRGSPIPFRSFLAATVPGTVVSLVGVAGMCIPRYLIEIDGGPVARLAVIWSVGLSTMAATALAWPRLRHDIHAVIDMVRAARRTPKPGRKADAAAQAPPPDSDLGMG